MASIGRICDQQQSTFSNKGISVYSKSQKRVKNGGRHKEKKKSGESNRVCGKNVFRRGELPGKYTVKMLYGWDNGKFEKEYLRKLERNW